MERPISVRDLLKWCRRLANILTVVGCKTGEEPVSETTRDWMFMEAIDCFVSSIKEPAARATLISKIGEAMHLSTDRVRHYMTSHIPKLEVVDSSLTVGRVSLRKSSRATPRTVKGKRPFAKTTHAKRLFEQVAVAVNLQEPVLLVGETGIGKTTVVQQMAELLGHKLIAVNLSQQSEAGDLLGGFKPVSSRSLAVPLKEEFEDLFEKTGVSIDKNQEYLDRIAKRFAKSRWTELAKELRKAPKMFETILAALQKSKSSSEEASYVDGQPAKRRKTESSKLQRLMRLKPRWEEFSQRLDKFERQVTSGSGSFGFAFIEGNIVKAARNGDWVLLDEINLASPDILESISDLFHSGSEGNPYILLSETGEIKKIEAHPDFRVFGAMNPATDIGKRDLPLGLRSRFTEIYVSSPDNDKKDLLTIIKTYLDGNSSRLDQVADSIADLYLEIKALADSKSVVDGANEVPHFSLRTLTRVLTYANDVTPFYGVERALYEGFCMGFLTLLSQDSEKEVLPRIYKYLLKRSNILSQPPKRPSDGKKYVSFKSKSENHQYWVLQGEQPRVERSDYIITPYVERNLLNLVRATSTRRYPILIQGPTSSGKTSMIEYLANFSGNKFVRINNHEHTDLQEYLGTYTSGVDGKLVFQEGLLVQAMRHGSWIVLDELNLAPSDVLEALNRLLDDNRELLIPETQEVVRPHDNFMLFATQNPPGLYGGRKVLSRAFRNRFLELHFDDIPEDQLETILQLRSHNTAPSDCKRIVSVYKQLSRLRQESRVFEQKNSFATLRDLFRWTQRDADNREQIAENGFMLLAERVRKSEERLEVKKVIEEVFKVKIREDILYNGSSSPGLRRLCETDNSQGVVWTRAMRRLYVLVEQAMRNNEPVLLVGETGCGKTTVCQLLAEAQRTELHIVNAHQNTETGDIIGSQRPVRNRGSILDTLKHQLLDAVNLIGGVSEGSLEDMINWYHSLSPEASEKLSSTQRLHIEASLQKSKALFEWCDGSLVQAMKSGQFFLLDEISLADDSVLERLNSVLEQHRTLLLAEKGAEDSFVRAEDGFQFFATMNPGGDFGKKELSPALRNRFTEIWVPALSEEQDVLDIVAAKLDDRFKSSSNGNSVPEIIVQFTTWFGQAFRPSSATAFSLRDILAWVTFMNRCNSEAAFALLHGAATVFIDTLGANPSALLAIDPKSMDEQRQMCLDKLSGLSGFDMTPLYRNEPQIALADHILAIGDFKIDRMPGASVDKAVELQAPTTKMNAMRVIRALQVNKPVLLEGSPGVGKTTLVSALARACGKPLTRINLSDQTDLMDLFGTDVPVEGSEAGNFAWKDAPFLQAMQRGEWVLLDEMNLASQSVLEGLNACLDHRGEVYISELDQVFKRHPDFRLFAAQNPHHQGGGRKGLPSSFVNRFIVVYADVFTQHDLLLITQSIFENIDPDVIGRLISFISSLDEEVAVKKTFGSQGSPWEFNLRDTLRWLGLLVSPDPLLSTASPEDLLDIVIRQRFRTVRDREEVSNMFAAAFKRPARGHSLYSNIDNLVAQVGIAVLPRSITWQKSQFPIIDTVPRLGEIESIMIAVKQDLPCILVGQSGSGKSSLLRHVAAQVGQELVIFPLNADVDTMDLIGGFEQADPHRDLLAVLSELRTSLHDHILHGIPREPAPVTVELLSILHTSSVPDVYPSLLLCIEKALAEVDLTTSFAGLLAKARDTLNKPLVSENPRFEWLDGVLVRAIEMGKWLVLDNANLCSASVLDRLNSLLERPDGFLSINEHSGPGGEPRVIRPHPDFRVFLTMDPKYGELSRAMRNRSVEIYLDGIPQPDASYLERITPIEANLQRYHGVLDAINRSTDVEQLQQFASYTIDSLSMKDLAVLDKFMRAMKHSQIVYDNSYTAPLLHSLEQRLSYAVSTLAGPMNHVFSKLNKTSAEKISPSLVVAHLGSSSPDGKKLSHYIDHIKLLYPLHPLQNPTLMALLDSNLQAISQWLGSCLEDYLEMLTGQAAMKAQSNNINLTKPSSLNRFQRSVISDQVATVARDSTVNGSVFLSTVFQDIETYLMEQLSDSSAWFKRRMMLRKLLHYWKRTFEFMSTSPFDEARFQAHLGHGSKLLSDKTAIDGSDVGTLASSVLQRLDSSFVLGFKLLTGLSMESLWRFLRPPTIADVQSHNQVAEMEALATRFDSLRWRASATVADLTSVLASFSGAYSAIRSHSVDGTDLIHDLRTEISSLESRVGGNVNEQQPFLATAFEALRQSIVLQQLSRNDLSFQRVSNITVLSGLPSLSQMRLQSSSGASTAFQSIDYIMSQDDQDRPWNGRVSESLLRRFDSVMSAKLFQLQLLDEELPIAGRTLVQASEALRSDTLENLANLLLNLITIVMKSHSQILHQHVVGLYEALLEEIRPSSISIEPDGLRLKAEDLPAMPDISSPDHPHLREIFRDHFVPSLVALAAATKGIQPKPAFVSIAWVQFSQGCVKLYVPDKIFDPYLRAEIELDFHRQLQDNLNSRLTTLRGVQHVFTGQSTNLRCELLEQELLTLGPPPSSQTRVYRPTNDELSKVQGEFNNILNAVVRNDVSSALIRHLSGLSNKDGHELQLAHDNISRLVERLSRQFSAYQDMTLPLVNFLRCLQVGLSLSIGSAEGDKEEVRTSAALLRPSSILSHNEWSVEHTRNFEFLSFVGMVVSVEGLDNLPHLLRQTLYSCLANYHEAWSKRLEAERKVEQSKQSLYRFRGSFEDEEEFDQEEFDEMFPDYRDDEQKMLSSQKKDKVKDLSVALAEAHEKIFLLPQNALESMQGLFKDVGRKISKESQGQSVSDEGMDAVLLPSALLVFDEQLSALHSAVTQSSYNFYTDRNIAEVQKLLALVSAIKSRFQDLQAIDEIGHHQTLADVIMASDKILELQIDDPLAKFITGVEYLHSFVYEWQEGGWASRANKVTALYERLTKTIHDWRRLELSSWAKLFDMEEKKCRTDTKSWWFIVYGAVIIEPFYKLQQGHSLKTYAVELLQILEGYFSDAIVGQFAARLQLLKQLKNQLDLLVRDEPALRVIRDAIQNFIVFYSRYKKKATEFIRNGRAPLDRKMKDVLLLTSWKDTNINALRESSRKSHQKLFRLVRKFRALLSQPMKNIIDQGLPDEEHATSTSSPVDIKLDIDPSAAMLCRELLPEFRNDAHWERFANPNIIVKIMAKLTTLPSSTVNGAVLMDSFVSDLLSSMASLKKETPQILTEENKGQVAHLKTRKTRLFVETLKTLRQMGFSRNLNTKSLERQNSTSAVLVDSGIMESSHELSLLEMEYYYQKTLDLAGRFRNATLDHSGDLSREAVDRSVGFLEGILNVMIQQRRNLCQSLRSLGKVEQAINYVRTVSDMKYAVDLQPESSRSNLVRVLRWLPQSLEFASQLVTIHSKLGGIDNQSIIDKLTFWTQAIVEFSKKEDSLPKLEAGLTTSEYDSLTSECTERLQDLRAYLKQLERERPDIAFIADLVEPWAYLEVTNTYDSDPSELRLQAFVEALAILSRKVLVAIQEAEKLGHSLPTSTEDASWLMNYNDGLFGFTKSLRMETLSRDIVGATQLLRKLVIDDIAVRKPACALLRVILPMLQQYCSICKQNVERLAHLHRSLCAMGYNLSKAFIQIASQGFCTPQEKSDEKSGDSGKLESGTGLGDGEGADDISKDIKPDEDLSELAQEPNTKNDGDIEDQEDAVDMGMDELEGDLGSVDGKDEKDEESQPDDEDGEEKEMDEETGDVDDLDPTAVDEKMWDAEDQDQAEKDQQGDKDKGQKNDDEQVGATENASKQDEDTGKPDERDEQGDSPEQDDIEASAEQEGDAAQEELNRQDQNVQEEDALALPDDMEIDISDGDDGEDDLDDLSDVEQPNEDADAQKSEAGSDIEDGDPEVKQDSADVDGEAEEEEVEEQGAGDDIQSEMDLDEEPDREEPVQEEPQNETKPEPATDQGHTDQDNSVPSDVRAGGGGQEDNEVDGEEDNNSQAKASQREHGQIGENSSDQDASAGNRGMLSRSNQEPIQSEEDKTDSEKTQPFKKLGDTLERWYRNQRDIQAATEEQQNQQKSDMTETEMAKAEFQHLQDDSAPADTQAMGGATDDEIRPLDESMAIDTEHSEPQAQMIQDEMEAEELDGDGTENPEAPQPQDKNKPDREDGRSGVATRQGTFNRQDDDQLSDGDQRQDESEDEKVLETSTQLSITHISESEKTLRDFSESLQLWATFQTKTHPLSLALTSQLRLILTPSQSTKLSGSFRTGKRLNIKKIIPYIASSYKRDKIWMRRSIPTKRAYQILLCVDDSKSMGQGTAGQLALESLVMVSRALSMLEVGQVGVLGFGADVFVAHDLLGPPFASPDAGGRALRHFTFEQDGTDIVLLLRRTIDMFRTARLQNTAGGRGGEDLWQLSLILSDGLTPARAHSRIRPLLREALEERVMVVFIIMDDARDKGEAGDSVLELKEARFTPDGDVIVERYLDSFPFPYYLIVHHLDDLPGALAGLLRTWFAEVNS
jgi:midasin